jgi:biotin carboxylase
VTRIVVVGCGFPQLSLRRAARRHGLFVVGADANPCAVGVPHCDEFVPVSTTDVEGLSAAVRRAGAVAVTTTGSEASLKATADVAARFGLPFYADPETVRRCQDKDAMRAGYRAAGLAIPAFAACDREGDALAFARDRGFPLVVKPARGWGQRGVARVEDTRELTRAFDEARAFSASAGLPSAIVEEWLDGREYSVNGWIEDGKLASYCVTERLTVPGRKPLGVMVAEVYPSGLSPADEARVVDEARRGAAALGHTRGPCYSQVAFGTRGAFLFETAARLGGGFDADVTRLASGVDLYDRLLGVALGDASLERQGAVGPVHGGAIAKFLIAPPGAVRAVRGLDEARGVPGVVDAQVFVPVGGRVFPLTDSAKRAAYALAHGGTRGEATARADAALAAITIEANETDDTSDTSDTPGIEASDEQRTEVIA